MVVGITFKSINKNNISSLKMSIVEMNKQNKIKKYLILTEKLSFNISLDIFKISEILKKKGVESN